MKYAEKVGNLLVLQRKKGSAGLKTTKDAFKTIGIANFPLHEAAALGGLREKSLPLQWCVSEKAYLVVNAIATERDHSETGSLATDDDNESVASATQTRSTAIAAASLQSLSSSSSATTAGRNGLSGNNMNQSVAGGIKPVSISGVGARNNNNNTNKDPIQRRLEELEATVLQSADIVDAEKAKTKESLIRAGKAEAELQELKAQRAAAGDSGATNLQIRQLTAELTAVRQDNEALQETQRRLSDLVGRASEESAAFAEEKAKVERALRDKNDECEALLAELIKTKLAVGDLSTELDEAKRALKMLKQQQQAGGQQLQATERGDRGDRPPRRSSTNNEELTYEQQQQLVQRRQAKAERERLREQQLMEQHHMPQQPEPAAPVTPMLRGFGAPSASAAAGAGRGQAAANPFAGGMDNIRRGFDSVSGNIFNNNNNGSSSSGTATAGGRKPAPARPVF